MDKSKDTRIEKAAEAVCERLMQEGAPFDAWEYQNEITDELRKHFAPQQPAEPQMCKFKYSKRHGVMSGYVCGQPLDKPIHRKWDGESREGAIDISHDYIAAEQSEPAKEPK